MDLALVTVRLDRVFDVVYRLNKKDVTCFGFQYGQKREFGICAPGRLVIEAGAVLSVCLRKQDDWTTVVGWYNHSTGAIVIESAVRHVFLVISCGTMAAATLWNADRLWSTQILLGLLMAAWVSAGMWELLYLRQVRAALLRAKGTPVPPLLALPGEQSNMENQ